MDGHSTSSQRTRLDPGRGSPDRVFTQHRAPDVAVPIAAGVRRADAALVSGLDPANLAWVNARLTKLRKRKEHLQEQLRSAERQAEGVDEAALRRWATERVTLLGEICRGRRDERARQVVASYVDRIVVDPRDRTGVLVFAGPGAADSQNETDPPKGGSAAKVIAGARVEPNLRPPASDRTGFAWGTDGVADAEFQF